MVILLLLDSEGHIIIIGLRKKQTYITLQILAMHYIDKGSINALWYWLMLLAIAYQSPPIGEFSILSANSTTCICLCLLSMNQYQPPIWGPAHMNFMCPTLHRNYKIKTKRWMGYIYIYSDNWKWCFNFVDEIRTLCLSCFHGEPESTETLLGIWHVSLSLKVDKPTTYVLKLFRVL